MAITDKSRQKLPHDISSNINTCSVLQADPAVKVPMFA